MSNDDWPSDSNEGGIPKPPSGRTAQPVRPSDSHPPERRDWAVPWILALGLHAAALGLVLWLRVPEAAPAPVPEVVHLVLSPESPPSEASRAFTEQPADRADSRSAEPEFLSNVDSRARDRVDGGDSDLPRMRGESDAALVKLEPGESSPRPTPAADARRTEPSELRAEPVKRTDTEAEGGPAVAQAESLPADRRPPAPPQAASEATIRVNPGTAGNSDIRQPEMNSNGNAGLTGDVSLNTTAWNYAPWMERFSRQLMRHWFAPPAYSLGVLKEGGWCVFDVEISRSGEILNLELQQQHGHPALTEAAISAVRSMAPMEPLPADFPEPTLMLRLRMIYPRIRPR